MSFLIYPTIKESPILGLAGLSGGVGSNLLGGGGAEPGEFKMCISTVNGFNIAYRFNQSGGWSSSGITTYGPLDLTTEAAATGGVTDFQLQGGGGSGNTHIFMYYLKANGVYFTGNSGTTYTASIDGVTYTITKSSNHDNWYDGGISGSGLSPTGVCPSNYSGEDYTGVSDGSNTTVTMTMSFSPTLTI